MPTTRVSVNLAELEPVKQTTRALFLLLHEVEASDPALLPDALREQAGQTRAVVDEWRKPDRHARRRDRD